VLVDDSAANLEVARAAGFSTVLRVGPGTRRPLAGGGYVDARIRSVRQLARRLG
jgi:FMN phosphatase YigB (HAD superfamily)